MTPRPWHPPVTFNGKTYDPRCDHFVHLNARGDYLYADPDVGYFIITTVRPRGCEPHYAAFLLVPDRQREAPL